MSKKCTECEKNKFVLPYEYFANPLTVVEQGGDWIQGAIKNPGRCTPGSPNYDCPKGSPQWNLAQRFKHGDLHKAQGGYQTKKVETKKDSVAHQANKILQYEQLRGGPGGTPLSYYSNPKYMDMLMNNVYPQVQDIMPNANAMESSEAMDFIFNAGRDPRIYMLDQYLKSKGQTGIPNRGSFNIDMNKDPQKWAQKKPELDAIWNQYSSQINSLPANTRRQFLNKGRDWYYQNINNPAPGVPSSDYNDTWYGRIWNTNDYNAFNPKNPKFTPKKEMGGDSQDQIMQLIMMYAKIHEVDPQMIVQKLQELDENGQQQAIKTMVAEVQQGAGQMQQQQMQEPQQQEAAPMSYADNDESQEMESYADGGAYGARGAVGFGQGIPYINPTINALTSERKGPFGKLLNDASGILGLVGATAGAALGYGKAAQYIGNKIKPGSNILQNTNNSLGNIVDFSTDLGYKRNRNINNMNNIPTPNLTQPSSINYNKIRNTDFTKQPQYNGEYDTMVGAYGGDIPKAQFGLYAPPNRAPYAQQNNTPDPNEYPQNNTVDAKARSEGSLIYNQYNNAIRSFGQPFNTDNMTSNQLNAFNNNKIDFTKPVIPSNEDPTIDESQFAPLPQNNAVPDQYMLDERQLITEEPNDIYETNPLKKKYIRDARRNNNMSNNSFNGMEYAQKSLAGLGAAANTIRSRNAEKQQREYEDMLRRTGNTDFGMASNSKNPFGNYTLNVGPSQNFQPGMTTPIQDFGTRNSKYGGQSYAEGGEYQVSEDELLQLMQEGAEIEFINK